MPEIIDEDALEDILGVQHVIYEIIFDEQSHTVYVFYIRNLVPKGTFTCLQGERDDIPEGQPHTTRMATRFILTRNLTKPANISATNYKYFNNGRRERCLQEQQYYSYTN